MHGRLTQRSRRSPSWNGSVPAISPLFRRGLTLIELLIALAILAILLALAFPSLRELIEEQRLRAHAEAFYSAISLTRSEAIKRNTRVTMCKGGRSGCREDGNWAQGWVTFVDRNGNGQVDGEEQIVAVQPPLTANRVIGNQPVAAYVSFLPSGFPALLNGAFQAGTVSVCPPPESTARPRAVVLNRIGRVRVTTENVRC